jgi:maltokinase
VTDETPTTYDPTGDTAGDGSGEEGAVPSGPSDDCLRQISEYLEGARWFGGKGRGARASAVRRLGVIADEGPRVVVELVEVTYDDGAVDFYQLPLSMYTDPEHRLDHAFVGWWEDPDAGWVHAYDAVHDRDAMSAYLRAFAYPPDGPIEFHRMPGEALDATATSTPFTGEQSNSSVSFGDQALLKLFRRITPGVNPDIEVHERLTRAGSDNVAALLGWIESAAGPAVLGTRGGGLGTGAERLPRPSEEAERLPRPSEEGGAPQVLQLAMLQQLLRTASDGWELALTSVRNLFAEADLYADEVGGDFAAEAQRLGEAVAQIHALLAEHFPTARRTAADHAELAEAMTRRLDDAIEVVPELAEHAPRLRELFAAAGRVSSGEIQRIHGDLHLGQTLRTSKGWKVVDFEGEPAKPLAERVRPDSPWRDVAGMLRSFDYAPRVAATTAASSDDDGREQRAFRAAEWSARNQTAFLESYAGRALTDDEQALLTAYVADKAVYECVYEARNRPSWLSIPMAAISAGDDSHQTR